MYGLGEIENFAISNVATAPSPATTGTSLIVDAGDGSKFPALSTGEYFKAVVCPANARPTSTNAEIIKVTAVSTDTLTIVRQQESTSARTIVAGDQIFLCDTKDEKEGLMEMSATGWVSILQTITRTGDHTFTIPGDWTDILTKGTKFSYNDGSVDFGVVASSSYSAGTGLTTVTLITNTDYAMAAGTITAPRYSYVENPQGYPGRLNVTVRQKIYFENGYFVLEGFGYKIGDGTTEIEDALTFGVTFASVWNAEAQALAATFGTTAPTVITDFSRGWKHYVTIQDITTTGMSVEMRAEMGVYSASYNFGYSFKVVGLF